MPFDAVIFDLDGTLLDTETIAFQAGLKVGEIWGLDFDEKLFLSLIGQDGPTLIKRIASITPEGFDAVGFKDAWTDMFREDAAAGIPVKPGVVELLDHLDAIEMPKAVATNSSTEGALLSLQRSGLEGRFAHVVGHDQVARPKPAPDAFLEAAKRLGVTPATCLAFEDSTLGSQAAKAAGMTLVQVPDMVPVAPDADHLVAENLLAGARAVGLIG